MKKTFALLLLGCFIQFSLLAQQDSFHNPLLPSGADPYSFFYKGYYYYTHTTGRNITIWKTKSIAKLASAEKKIVFQPPASGPYAKELWAPEIHRIDGKWYVYFAADSGHNPGHRLWVLENGSEDPLQGEWILKGKLVTPDDKWSIDASVFTLRNQLYCIWSGWEGDSNGQQNIYIARMANPWTITGPRALISKPELPWELHGDLHSATDPPHVSVNEGPEFLLHGDKMFLVYSASGCWTDFYALGVLTAKADSDPMDPNAWTKSSEPVFKQSPENGVYAPGHHSFFLSPNGKEYWLLYHANDAPGKGCGPFRSPRAQPFTWDANGMPVFGQPVSTKQILPVPAEK